MPFSIAGAIRAAFIHPASKVRENWSLGCHFNKLLMKLLQLLNPSIPVKVEKFKSYPDYSNRAALGKTSKGGYHVTDYLAVPRKTTLLEFCSTGLRNLKWDQNYLNSNAFEGVNH